MNIKRITVTVLGTIMLGHVAWAQAVEPKKRIAVTIENLAPHQGTFQTPFWVAFHDGNFDIYDRDQPASLLFPDAPAALERLAEDGTTEVIAQAFLAQDFGQIEATLPGPSGPIAPGEIVSQSFLLDPAAASNRYFSYASMILPSNDAFVANGNPLAHPIFDEHGNLLAQSFFISGSEVLDAGTEINDEIPENTAFFGQSVPNTGDDEQGLIVLHKGFNPLGSGGILDTAQFSAADFTQPGYPVVRVSFRAAPAILENRKYKFELSGEQEVPVVEGHASGIGLVKLRKKGTEMKYLFKTVGVQDITALHLHLGSAGTNGPVVAVLENTSLISRKFVKKFKGVVKAGDLTGPLKHAPLDALAAEIEAGNVYVNIHSESNPDGALRGQIVNTYEDEYKS